MDAQEIIKRRMSGAKNHRRKQWEWIQKEMPEMADFMLAWRESNDGVPLKLVSLTVKGKAL